MKSHALGVAVVRLQVPELHAGHRYLLNSVLAIHNKVLVVIGETEARLTPEDPLTYEMRAAMLKGMYPNVHVVRLFDTPSDSAWSMALDALIEQHTMGLVDGLCVTNGAVLYGGRDSFLSHYIGRTRTFELPPADPVSGTDIRGAVTPKDTADFRAGMIYASKHKYPVSYQCVDAAIHFRGQILLGQKRSDNGKWRFIGGFVAPQDASLEAAVCREIREETGVEPGNVTYLGSCQVNDYRYPKSGTDRIMSAFFLVEMVFGAAVASDDIDAVQWTDVSRLPDLLVPEHQPFVELLMKHKIFTGRDSA